MSQEIAVQFTATDDVDAEELDRLTQALRAEILQVDDVDAVDQATVAAPDGTKSVDVASIGALIVAAAPGVAALGKVIETVRGWFANRKASESSPTPALRMTIGDKSIEIVADKEQQDQLVAEFIAALQKD